jgi:hypothetical protein
MPTSNKRVPIDYEPSELAQIDEIAASLGLDRTTFIRNAVRAQIAQLGHIPSGYAYAKGKQNRRKAKGQ